jgi:hypothetical protein
MKHLYLYEKFNSNLKNLVGNDTSRFWYIKGNYKKVIKILKKCGINFGMDFETKEKFNMKGCFLGYDSFRDIDPESNKFSFYQVTDNEDFNNGKKYYSDENKYQGEIKLINDEIEIDTFDVDVENYNL